MPRSEIDPVYLDSAYYLAPNDKVAEEAFAVIREAMGAQGVVGLGRAVISRRERLFVLEPRDKGILATSLQYNYEVRDDHAYFDEIPDIEIRLRCWASPSTSSRRRWATSTSPSSKIATRTP